jgi:hypothetical protein
MLTAVDFFPPENTQFCAISPGNVHFKKSVKYNLKTGINDKWRIAGRASKAAALGIA